MYGRSPAVAFVLLTLGFSLGFALKKPKLSLRTKTKGEILMTHAQATFDVKLTPQDDKVDATLGRLTIDKQFHGDLEGTSKGQMLTAATDVKGSAAYVAIERVTGKPSGRTGSFSMHHTGVMNVAPHISKSP
jgi:hypothetical protein